MAVASKKGIDIIIKAFDYTKKGFDGVNRNIKGIDSATKFAGKSLKVMGTGIAGLAAGMGVALSQYAKFEKRIYNIGTLLGGNREQMKELETGILRLAKSMPVDANELAAGAYDIVSASVKGTANQLAVLEESGKLAVAGLGTVEESADLVTSAINAFGIDAADVNKVTNILFKTVKHGKNTVSDLAQSFGMAAPLINDTGVSLEEMSAATAAFTAAGEPASVAQTQLRSLMLELQKPSKEMIALLDQLGFDTGKFAIENEGLIKVLLKLKDAAKGDQELIGKLYGRIEGLTGAKILTGEGLEKFSEAMENMTDGTDELTQMYDLQLESLSALWQLIKNHFLDVLKKVGRIISEVFGPEIEWLRNLLEGLSDETSEVSKVFDQKLRSALTFVREILLEIIPAIWNATLKTGIWLAKNEKLIKSIISFSAKAAPFLAAFWAIGKALKFVSLVTGSSTLKFLGLKVVVPIFVLLKSVVLGLASALGVSAGVFGIFIAGALSWGIVLGKAVKDWEGFKDIWKRYWEGLKLGMINIGISIKITIDSIMIWIRKKLGDIGKLVYRIAAKITAAVDKVMAKIRRALGMETKLDKSRRKTKDAKKQKSVKSGGTCCQHGIHILGQPVWRRI